MTRRSALYALGAPALSTASPQQPDNLNSLPANLPVPLDDGACDHLTGMRIASVELPSTKGGSINLAKFTSTVPRIVVYCYPMTGVSSKDLPPGWNDIPGARGCTPQSCSLRDHYTELKRLGAEVLGLSVQSTAYQQEMSTRLHLPFAVLSDAQLQFANAMRLPTFSVENTQFIKRLTLVICDHKVEKVFYPVFPPDAHGQQIRDWLKRKPA